MNKSQAILSTFARTEDKTQYGKSVLTPEETKWIMSTHNDEPCEREVCPVCTDFSHWKESTQAMLQ